MWEAEVATDVAAPADVVYGYLSDFKRHREWSRGLSEIEQVTGGEVRVGTEFKATETVPMKFASSSRVTALEAPRRIAWDAWVEGMMRAQWEFELAPSGRDGTHVVLRCRFQPAGLFSKLMFNAMRRWQIPGENRQSLARVKSILEGGAQ